MVETHGRKLNGIEYHDYVLMVAALDTEWTRNPATAGEVFEVGLGTEPVAKRFY